MVTGLDRRYSRPFMSRLILIHSKNGCVPEVGMRYLGAQPHSETAQAPKLQFGKTTVYMYPENPAVSTSVGFTHSSTIITKLSRNPIHQRVDALCYGSILLIRNQTPVGLERAPLPNPMGVGVRNNISSTFTNSRLR